MTIDLSLRFRSLQRDDLAILERSFPQPTPTSHTKRLEYQDDGLYSYVCVESGGEIAGIQLIRWNGPKWDEDRILSELPEIGSLYILPQFRNHGIGSALVRYSESLIAARKFVGVGAIIKDNNDTSINIHVRDGYTRIGTATRAKNDPDQSRSYYVKQLLQTKS